MMNNALDHINRIRRDKYGLDENGRLRGVNPLASDLQDSIEHLSEGLYSINAHFIFELIQNAEDNAYKVSQPSLSLKLLKADPTSTHGASGALIFQNNEVGFSEENVNAICAVGKTTKSKIQGYIGEKGIGFKSVFQVTSDPHIFSNGYSFCLPEKDEETCLGYIVPKWIEQTPEGIDPTKTTIILPLDKVEFSYEKIEKMLRDIAPETILFLSKLKKFTIYTDTGDNISIIKDDSKAPLIQVLVDGTKVGIPISKVYEFLVYPKVFSVAKNINHEKRIGIADREVTIAYPLNEKNDSTGKIFAYLPIIFNSGLPFLINADFTLTSSREAIQENQPWNRWLAECVAELIGETLEGLKKYDHLTVDFLEKLSRGIFALDENNLLYPIVGAIRNAFKSKELLPADDGTFVSGRNAKLASAEWLRKVLQDEQLIQLFKTQNALKWISGEVTERSKHDLWKYIREVLKVEEVTPDSFVRKLDDLFLKKQTDEWMIEFYVQLVSQKALWKKGTNSWRDNAGPLRAKAFIRLQDGRHVKPFRDDDSPNAYLPAGANNDTSLPIVKVVLTEQEDARRFLNELGIPELDIVAEVIEHIVPKYLPTSTPVSFEEHKRDIEKVRQAYKTDSQEKKQRLRNALQETAFLLTQTPGSDSPAYRKPSEAYFPDETLKMYFSGNSTVGFVSSDYEESALDMFKDLEVSEDVRVSKRCPDYRGFITIRDWHGSHERGLNGFDPEIDVEGLEYALASPSLEKSAFIWNLIAIPNIACIRGTVEISSRQTYENCSTEDRISELGCLLIENSWLPGPDGVFQKPSELCLDDLPAPYERNEKLADQLGMRKDVVADLAEKAGIQAEDIELMRQYPEEFQQWKAAIAARNEKPIFPNDPVKDSERRRAQIEKELAALPEKEYETLIRTVRTSRGSVDPRIYLREKYTTNNRMVCQICKEEMPFKKRDGEYYFEAVEALSREYFPKEHEAQFLALCPLCAAMYKEFIKEDKGAMADLRNILINANEFEVPLRLGGLDTSIRFVESHFSDIRTILGEQE